MFLFDYPRLLQFVKARVNTIDAISMILVPPLKQTCCVFKDCSQSILNTFVLFSIQSLITCAQLRICFSGKKWLNIGRQISFHSTLQRVAWRWGNLRFLRKWFASIVTSISTAPTAILGEAASPQHFVHRGPAR